MIRPLAGAAALMIASGVFAAPPLFETEPNDSFATANFIPSAAYPTGGVAIDGVLDSGDVDYFSFALSAGDFVTFSIFDFTPDDPFDNDSLLGVFAPDGSLFDEDDDDGPGFLSSYAFLVPESGVWAFAVSGFGDFDYVGDHDEVFAYKAIFGHNPAVPAPGAIALLGLAGLTGRGRRRR